MFIYPFLKATQAEAPAAVAQQHTACGISERLIGEVVIGQGAVLGMSAVHTPVCYIVSMSFGRPLEVLGCDCLFAL